MLRIALVGRGKEGKSIVAEHLRKQYNFNHKSLADPLKEFIRKLYWYDKNKAIPWELRIDWYDTFYKKDNDVWVKNMENRLTQQRLDVVVDDVRYMNEVEYLRKIGFIIVRVNSKIKSHKALGKNYSVGTIHLAESYSKDFTVTLAADYSIKYDRNERAAARKAVDLMIESIRSKS